MGVPITKRDDDFPAVRYQPNDIMRPGFIKQIRTDVPDITMDERNSRIRKRASIFKKNVAIFFNHLYAAIYGGEVKPDPWGNGLSPYNSDGFTPVSYTFSPDVHRVDQGRDIYSEIKASSGKSLQLHCSVNQASNNLCEMLLQSDKNHGSKAPMLEYGFFVYGDRNSRGLPEDNPQSLNALAGLDKRLLVVPLNLFLYLLPFSRLEQRNQESSRFSEDNPVYRIISGQPFSHLMMEKPINQVGNYPRAYSELEDLLCLNEIKIERSAAPETHGYTTEEKQNFPFVVNPFPITRYLVPQHKYGKVIKHMKNHHEEIAEIIQLQDIYGEIKKISF